MIRRQGGLPVGSEFCGWFHSNASCALQPHGMAGHDEGVLGEAWAAQTGEDTYISV